MRKTTISIRLPHLRGENAYMAALLLEQVVEAIWQECGDDMADFQGRVFPDGPPDPDDEPPDPPDEEYLDPEDFDEIPI